MWGGSHCKREIRTSYNEEERRYLKESREGFSASTEKLQVALQGGGYWGGGLFVMALTYTRGGAAEVKTLVRGRGRGKD